MLRRAYHWLQGWVVTLDIRLNNPELYRSLTQPMSIDDFEEVDKP